MDAERDPSEGSKQHLDNLRRKSSAQRIGNSRVSVHLGNDSASNIEGSALQGLVSVQDLHRGKGLATMQIVYLACWEEHLRCVLAKLEER